MRRKVRQSETGWQIFEPKNPKCAGRIRRRGIRNTPCLASPTREAMRVWPRVCCIMLEQMMKEQKGKVAEKNLRKSDPYFTTGAVFLKIAIKFGAKISWRAETMRSRAADAAKIM